MTDKTAPKTRNAELTKKKIMAAALVEFSTNGLAGARVDVISERAKANKRMIYHYFGNKEDLFQTVLENSYLKIRNAEQRLKLDHLDPIDALKTLVTFTWEYYIKNPEFITLVNSENLHKAKHLKKSKIIKDLSRNFVLMVSKILEQGVRDGAFRQGIDPVQLNITIAAIGYYYHTNRYTGEIIFERKFLDKKALDERLAFNLETIIRLVKV